ncbi:DNA replication licensing factor, MCM7 component [Trachipleistophora hominis]|uniref:DNA replication licensing factor MCM7 n=1 Tax=Trachipleistophora hominis TaxID=72359 RepID=L7JYU4_TRAHO|nr:DNA replication licensing factor, MCM7 component [Trachipleistophora hominis]
MSSELKQEKIDLNYSADKSVLSSFIHFFTDNNNEPKYLNMISHKKIALDLNDIAIHDHMLVNRLRSNFMTYLRMLYEIIDGVNTPSDVAMIHRLERMKEKYPGVDAAKKFPPALMRDYVLDVVPHAQHTLGIRMLRSDKVGHFVTTRGIVTKVSHTRPSIKVAVYVCDSCGSETYQQVNNQEFTLLAVCQSEKCKTMKIRGTLSLITRVSKFEPFVSVCLQEMQGDTPEGCIPRVINIEMKDAEVRPGDCIYVCGVLMARQLIGLMNEIYLEGFGIAECKTKGTDDLMVDGEHVQDESAVIGSIEHCDDVTEIDRTNYSVQNLMASFAPHIYGMYDVKKILLLMLIGSPSITKADGMRIRGDLNVMLMGDPGIAKSELLKYCIGLARRGVYTAGRGSSGVGLTASVLRDPFTKEFVLEAGALVLSDRGICCLDEMDKMDENDRLSLHEVLEQQSISINKAGINVRLNARCCVLGAANFKKGFYDDKKSLEHNTGLPVSLISRFDVIAILRDEKDESRDRELAEYVARQHLKEGDESGSSAVLSHTDLKTFIQKAKTLNPRIPSHLNERIVGAYTAARDKYERLTPRFLLSLIRLSMAHARLRLSEEVNEEDVEESVRLLEVSKLHKVKDRQRELSPKYQIYNQIMKMKTSGRTLRLEDVVRSINYDEQTILNVIKEFEENGIWVVEDGNLHIFD